MGAGLKLRELSRAELMELQEPGLCCQPLFALPALPVFAPWGWERSPGSCIPRDKLAWMFWVFVVFFGGGGLLGSPLRNSGMGAGKN